MVIAVQTQEISSTADSKQERIESNISKSVRKKIKSVGEKQACSSKNVRLINKMVVPTIRPLPIGGDTVDKPCPECYTVMVWEEYANDLYPETSNLEMVCPNCKYEAF